MAVTSKLGITGLLLLLAGCTAAGSSSVETPERSDSGRPTTGDTSTDDGTREDVLGDGSGSSADTSLDGSAADDAGAADSGSGTDTSADTLSDGSDGSGDGPVICATTTAPAVPAVLPADIIWVVDNSLSMQEEVTAVSANLNRFANFIISSGIDAQVVMVSNDDPTVGDGKYHVCVPPPLSATAAGVCPLGRDLDGERYYHERVTIEGVSSSNTRTNALTAIVNGYPNYRSRLRPGATTHIVVVSDDDSAITAAEFDLLALFARHPNRPLNRDQIMEQAHNRGWDVFDRSIDVQVSRLRRKIEAQGELIKTIRGAGYLFAAAVRRK